MSKAQTAEFQRPSYPEGTPPYYVENQAFTAAFEQALQPGDFFESLGLQSLQGKTVADIGCADGEYFEVWERAGVHELFAIEPSGYLPISITRLKLDELARTVSLPVSLIFERVEDVDLDLAVDVAIALNVSPGINEQEVFRRIWGMLKVNGQLLLTTAEPSTWERIKPAVERFFNTQVGTFWNNNPRYADGKVDPMRYVDNETVVIGEPKVAIYP